MKFSLALPLSLAASAVAGILPPGFKSNATTAAAAAAAGVARRASDDSEWVIPPGGTHSAIGPPSIPAVLDPNDLAVATLPPPGALNHTIKILVGSSPRQFGAAPILSPPRGSTFALIHRTVRVVPRVPGLRGRTTISCYAQAVLDMSHCMLWNPECICTIGSFREIGKRAFQCMKRKGLVEKDIDVARYAFDQLCK